MATNQKQQRQPPAPSQAQEPAEKKGPIARFRYPVRGGSVTCSVWDKPVKNDNGEDKLLYSVSVQRSYHDGQNWAWTGTLRDEDIPAAIFALQDAYRHIAGLKQPGDTPF